ncbi:MAG: ATP-binding protein [Polyangiaceae bacterium]|nr:ATP-binding protein [Polyangiaceae bacterium]
MLLTDSERQSLALALVEGNPTSATLRTFLVTFAPEVPAIPEGANPFADALTIVGELDDKNPTALLKVLRQLGEGDADMATIADRVAASLAAPPKTAWLERLIGNRRVVLDRGPLRQSLKTLLEAADPKLLLVTGPRGSGKTRTTTLVRHVATTHKHPFAVVEGADTMAAYEVVEQLLVQLKEPDWKTDPVDSPNSHWYRKQCARVVSAVNTQMDKVRAQRAWLVIDDIGPETGTVAEFCDYFARAIAPTDSGIRFVLLSYPRAVLPDSLDEAAVNWDKLTLGTVRESEVSDLVAWLYSDLFQKPLTAEGLAAEVAAITGGLAPEHEGFLDKTRREIEERLRTMVAS